MTVATSSPDERDDLIDGVARTAAAWDRYFWIWAAVFVCLFSVCSIVQDLRTKMWNDEIVTLLVAQQSGPIAIIRATKDGMDATPPLYPIIVSGVRAIVHSDALVVRLPSTLGFSGMLLAILAFCRRRMPPEYALLAASTAILSCGFYATEGRCYGCVLGCAAAALWCWQAAAERKARAGWLVGIAAFLSLATAFHYYSIFLLVPLGAAELLRWRRSGHFDTAVAAVLASPLVVLGLHYPLIHAGTRYLAHFWVPGIATWRAAPEFYLQYALIPAGIALAGLVALALTPESRRVKPVCTLPAHVWTLLAALSLMPVVVAAISLHTIHVFLARYVLWSVLGLAIGSSALLWRCSHELPRMGRIVAAVLTAAVCWQGYINLRQPVTLRQAEALQQVLASVPIGPEPIVVAHDHGFMELSYYSTEPLRHRLIYPLSEELELRYEGSDLDYRLLSAISRHTNLQIENLNSLLVSHPDFILVATPKDYLPRYLISAGYRLASIASREGAVAYQVYAPQ